MAAEFTANALQTVAPGESVIFTEASQPIGRGLIRHRDGTGNFLLSGWLPNFFNQCCCCCRDNSADYMVRFGANISIPTGGTVGEISLAITVDGATIPASTMIAQPAAVEVFENVNTAVIADVWLGCCETVTVRNTSDQPIQVQNANIIFSRPDLTLTY